MDGTYESIYLVAFILAGPVYNNVLKNYAALLCRTQRRVADMCSSTVSDTANMRIHGAQSASCGRKNPLPFPYSLSSANFAVLSQREKG